MKQFWIKIASIVFLLSQHLKINDQRKEAYKLIENLHNYKELSSLIFTRAADEDLKRKNLKRKKEEFELEQSRQKKYVFVIGKV